MSEDKLPRLPDAELEVMKVIWEAGRPVTSADVMEQLKGVKTWGVTTVLNLLARLLDRGFVTSERQGRFNAYTALVQEKDYLKHESKSILQRLYGNSLKSFVASLYDSQAVSKDELEELRKFIEERAKEG
ncbi:BlaI/MecI/CopY family transcriptional regulator [Paenibacillus puerhi]|uniref:BlaI/MecI/CopY family transcriptional regulator n=1 Tax=Paenibacillus puerhi TaxID=2692622 RepID=UPI001356C8C3|nr:BlaI/MecI/CopY family transcriptional regulator [Paenibacillus puerhi]